MSICSKLFKLLEEKAIGVSKDSSIAGKFENLSVAAPFT